MTKAEKRERLAEISGVLTELYPDAACALNYEGDPWKLLVMGRLSAQCTDARVNIVCRELFAQFPDARSMADGDIERIEELEQPCLSIAGHDGYICNQSWIHGATVGVM